jgi:hypothetical protein
LLLGQGPQRGVEPRQPGRVAGHPGDRVAGVDEPVDVGVHADAVVVRVHHVVGLEALDHVGPEGGDGVSDEFDGQRYEVLREAPATTLCYQDWQHLRASCRKSACLRQAAPRRLGR